MKQVIRRGFSEIIVDDVPEPMVVPHHLLIRPAYSLISSGTELASIHTGGVLKEAIGNPSHIRKIWEVMKIAGPLRTIAEVKAKFAEYAVLGYSGAGVVADKHETVSGFDIGDGVAYGGEGTGHGELVLTGQNLAVKVPEGVPLQHASFATLGSIAMNAVRIANIALGDRVVILGLGLVGQLVAQLARLQGGVVLGIDLKPHRVELARLLGAEHAVLAGSTVTEAIMAWTHGRGADCVIVAAASESAAPCEQALNVCRDRGRLIILGAVEMSFPWLEMYSKEIQLFMSRAYGPGSYDPEYEKQARDYPISYVRWTENRNMEEFLRLVASHQVEVQPLITHEFMMEEAPKAYLTLLDSDANSLAVLLRYGRDSAEPAIPIVRHKVQVTTRPKQDSDLGIALIGAGNVARWTHLPILTRIPHVKLVAVHSSSGVRGKSYAIRFGALYCCSDYEQILSDADIEAIVITSRNQHHAGQALSALQAGKHVFLEKPMALTEEECRSLCQAARRAGKQITVGFNRRFSPFYRDFQERLARRTGPAVINCRVNSPAISGTYWMADPKNGGAILGEACHFVDLMYWLLESEPISVFAYSLPRGHQEPVGENNVVASFSFEDGSIGNLTYCTVGSKTSAGERVEAFAPGIGLITENFKRLTVNTALRHQYTKWRGEKGYAAQLESFVTALRQGSAPAVTVRDGARATIACVRMMESAGKSEPCVINLDAAVGDE